MDGEASPQYFSHSQYFLLLCLAALAGIFLGSSGGAVLSKIGILLIVGVIALGVFRNSLWGVTAGCIALSCAAGMAWTLRFDRTADYRALLAKHDSASIIEEGIIDEEVRGGSVFQRLVVRLGPSRENMRILVTVPPYPAFSYGDRVRLAGALAPPRNTADFDYAAYLRKSNIYAVLNRPSVAYLSSGEGNPVTATLLMFKKNFVSRIDRMVGEPHASLVRGILLGEDLRDPVLRDEFTKTGLIHITALSGSNISLIALFLSYFTNWLLVPRRIAFFLNTVLIILFTLMVGAPASVVRAAVMGILVLTAREMGRASTALYAIVFAGFLMALSNPLIVRFDIGFQLSFLAILSLVYLGPLIAAFIPGAGSTKSFLGEYCAATLAAQLGTMPLILYAFGVTSLIAPLANLLVLPVIPFMMLLGFAAGLISFAIPFLAYGVGLIMMPLLGYVLWIVHVLARVPFAAVSWGKGSRFLLVVLFAVLIGIIIATIKKGKLRWYGSVEYPLA